MDLIDMIVIGVLVVVIVLLIVILGRTKSSNNELEKIVDDLKTSVQDMADRLIGQQNQMMENQRVMADMQASNLKTISDMQNERLGDINDRLDAMNLQNEQKLQSIRETMNSQLTTLRTENTQQLEKMRDTVDEKLQETLESRISESFAQVTKQLQEVYAGLGEMKNLASGVGDLKKVLTNVKTRGILGEIQLGAILEQILSPEQYDENVNTAPSNNDRVEFAVKMPGDDDRGFVYLPIDAKFPGDTYQRLVEAYESGDKDYIESCRKDLKTRIKGEAKDISSKYIEPPYTTDFAIMFLPFEGLYSEVVNMGLVEELQNTYRVNIAGPTTMAALLNSLQMGFRTLAIQKHSGQITKTLESVKTEFGKFEKALLNAQDKIRKADKELDVVITTRTNVMNRALRSVGTLDDTEARDTLSLPQYDNFDRLDEE